MLYMKSSDLKNLGIDADEVLDALTVEDYLREISGNWHRGIWCYVYSTVLDKFFYIEDVEPNYHSPVGSVLRVAPERLHQASRKVENDCDLPF